MSTRRSRATIKTRRGKSALSKQEDYLVEDTFAVEPEVSDPIGSDGKIISKRLPTDDKGRLLQISEEIDTEDGQGFVDNSTIIDGISSSDEVDPETIGLPGTAISDDQGNDEYKLQKAEFVDPDSKDNAADEEILDSDPEHHNDTIMIDDLRWDVILTKAYLFAREKKIPLRLVISDKVNKDTFYTIPDDISYLISTVTSNWETRYAQITAAVGDVEAKFLFDIFDLLKRKYLVWMNELDFIFLLLGQNRRGHRLVTNVLKDKRAIISAYNAEYENWYNTLVSDNAYEKHVFMNRASIIAEMMTGFPGEGHVTIHDEETGEDVDSEDEETGEDVDSEDEEIGEDVDSEDEETGEDVGSEDEETGEDVADADSEDADDVDDAESGQSGDEESGDVDDEELKWDDLEMKGGSFDKNIFSTLPDVQGIKQRFTGRMMGLDKGGIFANDIIEVFKLAKPNAQIPAVKYVSGGHNVKTKIYVAKSKDREGDMEYVDEVLRGMNAPNSIHFVYLLPESYDIQNKDEREREMILADIPHEYYIGVSWSFSGGDNSFLIDLTVKQVKRIGVVDLDKIGVQIAKWVIDPIRQVFPGVYIEQNDDYHAKLEYDLHGVKIEDNRFLFYLLNTQKMYLFLHSKENPNPYAFRGNLKAIFKHPLTSMSGPGVYGDDFEMYPDLSTEVSLKGFDVYNVANIKAVNTSPVPMENVLFVNRESNPDRGLTRITLENVRKRDMLVILSSMELVMRTYAQSVQFDEFIAKQEDIEVDLSNMDGRRRKKVKLESLSKQDPSLFKGEYSKKCQKIRQPRIIPESDVVVDGSYTVKIGGIEYEIPKYKEAGTDNVVMDFAGNSGKKFFYGCYGEKGKFAYPGLVRNPQAEEKLLPCCFGTDQRGIPTKNKPTVKNPKAYLEYKIKEEDQVRPVIRGQTTEDAYSGRLIKTQKILTKGAIGQLTPMLEQFLNIAIPDRQIYRMGVNIGPKSFIDAMLSAVGQPVEKIPNFGRTRQENIKAISSFLAMDKRYHAVVKQEAFDMTENEISAVYRDPEVSLDPEIFYRAMEELFNVNILIVNTTSKESNSSSAMIVPRSMYYHIHKFDPNRGFVIINKTWGTEALSTKEAHTELIVGFEDSIDDKTYIFEEDNIANLISLFNDLYKVKMSVMTQEGVKTRYMGPAAYEDIITSLESLYSGQKNKPLPVSQHIDEAGKMRRLTLKIGREYVTVGFEPKAPALLPTSDKIYPASTKFTAKMKTYEVAVSGDLDKTVFGVWYRMDNGSLFMTSVDKYPVIQGDIDVEWIPPAFFPQSQRPMVSMSRNIEEMKIYKNKLITAVEWYFISMSRDRLDFGIDEFLEYFHLDESRSMPDMTMFLENISVFKNVSDYDNRDMVLNYLSETTEGLISGDAIVIGSRKIYNWLLDHIPRINVHDTVNFIRRRRSSIKTPPPEDVSLIEGLEQINVWKSSINSKQDLYERFSANQTYTTRDSIIMAPVGNKMAPFISMTFNRIEEALFAADYWRREKQIPSRKTVSTQADKTVLSLPRIMYVLTDTRRVVFAKNVTKGNPDYLYILYTGNSQGLEAGLSKQHAALLPLF